MNKETPQQKESNKFIASDRMVVNILVSAALGLVIMAVSVGITGDTPRTVWAILVAALIISGSIVLARRGNSLPGRILVPATLSLTVGYIAINRGGLYHISIVGFPVIIVLAGSLLGVRGSFLFAAVASIVSIGIGVAEMNGLTPLSDLSRTGYDDIIVITTLNFLTAIVLRVIINRLRETIRETETTAMGREAANVELKQLHAELEERVAERTSELARRATQIEAIMGLSEPIAEYQNLDLLIDNAAAIISERLGFYHVGIFLLDKDRGYAVLQAANSDGGKRMLERGHRLQIGTGVVGVAAKSGKPRIALDVGADAVFFDNPDLPDTRSEAALPLVSRGDIIGVLDVQSKEAGAFSNEDLQVLTALGNQVSIAIENARLLTETRTALAQAQQVYQEFTRAEWKRAVSIAEQPGFRYRSGRIELLDQKLQTPEVISAIERGRFDTDQAEGSNGKRAAIAVPVKLRGEVIGILHVESNNSSRDEWQKDEISLVEAVAERAAFAMENARLFQDARRRAAKERMISEASGRIGSAFNIENILQSTAEELERVLGGSEVLIRFQNKEQS